MINVSDIVADACRQDAPIVALETAVLTSGLPKQVWQDSFGECPTCIDASLPIHIALAEYLTRAINACGAVPAWIGVLDGVLRIGLSKDELQQLCRCEHAGKVSLANFSQTLQEKQSAGSTVAATLQACKLASTKHPIRVFATGGIGGIHQNWASRLDISADLTALATTQTCVVASGAKSILDLHATVEALETIGVPTVGFGTKHFPPFIEKATNNDPPVLCVESAHEIANLCKTHWETLRMPTAVLATIPAPNDVAIKRGSLTDALRLAEEAWIETNQPSATRTPFLLCELARITDGKSLVANIELLCNNAKIAAEIAVAM